jgi:hypothetical protein
MKSDNVNHPPHYGGESNTYEAIKVIEAWQLGFHLGNAVKYIARAGKKSIADEIEDLEKAKWYLERRIERITLLKEAVGYWDPEAWQRKFEDQQKNQNQ